MTHFCPNCNSEQPYSKFVEEITVTIDGNTLSYKTLIPYCLTCKSKLSIPEFDTLNEILQTVDK
jgi:hypothetical protein